METQIETTNSSSFFSFRSSPGPKFPFQKKKRRNFRGERQKVRENQLKLFEKVKEANV